MNEAEANLPGVLVIGSIGSGRTTLLIEKISALLSADPTRLAVLVCEERVAEGAVAVLSSTRRIVSDPQDATQMPKSGEMRVTTYDQTGASRRDALLSVRTALREARRARRGAGQFLLAVDELNVLLTGEKRRDERFVELLTETFEETSRYWFMLALCAQGFDQIEGLFGAKALRLLMRLEETALLQTRAGDERARLLTEMFAGVETLRAGVGISLRRRPFDLTATVATRES